MPRSFEGDLNAEGLRFGVIASRFNDDIVAGLLDGALDCLKRHGARDEDIDVIRVPGAFEIPTVARTLAGRHDALIALSPQFSVLSPHALARCKDAEFTDGC